MCEWVEGDIRSTVGPTLPISINNSSTASHVLARKESSKTEAINMRDDRSCFKGWRAQLSFGIWIACARLRVLLSTGPEISISINSSA